MSNPNDTIRDGILRHICGIHKKARSPKTTARGIRDITTGMKKVGYKQQAIASNLDYWIQKGWVREVVEQRTFTTERGTTQNSEKRSNKISDTGIDKLEAASIYKRAPNDPRINITNISGVTVIGDGNVVNTDFTELSRTLNDLKQAVFASQKFSDTEKLSTIADIDTLQAQLQKPEPNRPIVKAIWTGVEKIVTAGGLVELSQKIGTLLAPLLS
jgi:hypothetical protein